MEAFSELRAGMIVVDKDCACCGAPFHRGMLLGPRPRWMTGEPVFDTAPTACYGKSGRPSIIGEETVARRCVFRVVDGLENDQAHSTSKKTNQPARVR